MQGPAGRPRRKTSGKAPFRDARLHSLLSARHAEAGKFRPAKSKGHVPPTTRGGKRTHSRLIFPPLTAFLYIFLYSKAYKAFYGTIYCTLSGVNTFFITWPPLTAITPPPDLFRRPLPRTPPRPLPRPNRPPRGARAVRAARRARGDQAPDAGARPSPPRSPEKGSSATR